MCDEGYIIADYTDEKNRNLRENRNSILHPINKFVLHIM
ncbi:hypothetical protein GTP20_00220 [Vibrio alginolyticus]|nr:hypothetical protein [Vibrio alginolyticus]EGQ8486429.1 hypothetical protein [Vibrio alginolyticus]